MPYGVKMHKIREVLLETLELKDLARSGWVKNGVINCESVASHTWGVSWLVIALCPEDIDLQRALVMATIHDIAEIRVGDITPNDDISTSEKHTMESNVIKDIFSNFTNGNELYEIWMEYELQLSPESKFVKYCDKLDMALQAQKYMLNSDKDLNEFIDSAISTIANDNMKDLANFNRYQY